MSFTIKCNQCGKTFTSTQPRAKYCSDKCKNVAYRSIHPQEEATCIVCGITFMKRVHNQIVCGEPSCRLAIARKSAQANLDKLAKIREFYIFERDNFTCAYCGKSSFADGVKLHVDHIIPASHGGKSIAGNLITSCITCNVTKQDIEIECKDEIIATIRKRNKARGIDNEIPLKLWADNYSKFVSKT